MTDVQEPEDPDFGDADEDDAVDATDDEDARIGAIWLHDLPDALAGLGNVTLYDGWRTRSRKSGGYDALLGIVVHHTASTASAYSDTKYMWENSTTRPVGAIYLARNGEVIVGAAGATNCAGLGGPVTTSKGTIAKDTANSRTISIEAGNAGTGEQWPKAQQESYVALVAALCDHYDFDPIRDVLAHFEWAPGRKIDPAGQSRYASGRASWNMDLFRNDVTAKMDSEPPPTKPKPPPLEEDDMPALIIQAKGGNTPGAVAVTDLPMTTKRFIYSDDAVALLASGFYGAGIVNVQGNVFDAIPGNLPVDIVDT